MGYGKGIRTHTHKTDRKRKGNRLELALKTDYKCLRTQQHSSLLANKELQKSITVIGYNSYLQKEGLKILDSSVCVGRSDVIAAA